MLCQGYVDCWPAADLTDPQGRLACSFVRVPPMGLLAVYSIYLMPGDGMAAVETNQAVMARLVQHIISHPLEWVIAGDWNLDPHVVQQLPWVVRSHAVVLVSAAPTCHPSVGEDSWRDFFVVSSLLASAQLGAATMDEVQVATHAAVGL